MVYGLVTWRKNNALPQWKKEEKEKRWQKEKGHEASWLLDVEDEEQALKSVMFLLTRNCMQG
jgi:hypothetical protein